MEVEYKFTIKIIDDTLVTRTYDYIYAKSCGEAWRKFVAWGEEKGFTYKLNRVYPNAIFPGYFINPINGNGYSLE